MKKYITDDAEPMLSDKIRGAIDLVRPLTLLPPLGAGIFITMVPILLVGESVSSYWSTLIYIGVTLALLQGAGQCVNQAYGEEVEIDILNGKTYRPVVRGVLSKEEALGIGILLLFFGIARAFTIHATFGMFALVLAFFSFFYTFPPIRAKKRRIVNVLWLGISRGLLPVLACFSVFNTPFSPVPITWGVLAFVWVVAFNPVKDMPDVKGDRAHFIPSVPAVAGKVGTLSYVASFTVIFTIVLDYSLPYLPPSFAVLWVLPLVAVALTISLAKGLRCAYIENNVAWLLFYVGLALLFLLPPIALQWW